ncbi:hypothetical protein [uncultured Rikenella sp.]|uniref:hypothetical protein n=1 Tax=uncultured Rikenella sp. TaxID=368003 RepID=UPI00261D341C|nr:hypothetical protein [uncultured Rikenella sp.]
MPVRARRCPFGKYTVFFGIFIRADGFLSGGRSGKGIGFRRPVVQVSCGPAPGFRGRSEGAIGGVGDYGYSWSFPTRDTNGMFLGIGTVWLNPSSSDYRGYGYQLRCLSE